MTLEALEKIKENVIFLDEEATADVAFIARGHTLDEAFAYAGLALYHVIVDIDTVEPVLDLEKEWDAEDLPGLLYDYLDDLIFLFDTEELLLTEIQTRIKKQSDENFKLLLKGKGEKYNEQKHKAKTHVKAVTFFGMEVSEKRVKVTLDI